LPRSPGAKVELDLAAVSSSTISRASGREGESVELDDDEGVAGAASGEGFV